MATGERFDQMKCAERWRKVSSGAMFVAVIGIGVFGSHRAVAGQAIGLEQRVSSLEQQVASLQTALTAEKAAREAANDALNEKTQFISVSGTDTIFTGTNVHIRNGLGTTDTSNELGNLTIGYNALRGSGDNRFGSHYLILGDKNNYSAYGGIVAGLSNTASGAYASASGGNNNTASGQNDTVTGGSFNTAASNLSPFPGFIGASVTGGAGNRATNGWATVCGGNSNLASGQVATVSGGYFSTASGFSSSVSGGFFVTQSVGTGWAGGAFHTP